MPYYTRAYNPQPTARVTSQELKNEFQSIDNALDAVETDVGKGIRAPEATTALPNAASRALKVLSFDASGNPIATVLAGDVADAADNAAIATTKAAEAAASAVAAHNSELAAAASAATVDIPALESGKYLSNNGVDMVWQAITPPQVLQRAITSTDTLIASDLGKLINASGTFTLSVTAASTLGDGWYCWLRNTSNGDVTVDPASTEQIDGAATYVLKPGFTVLVACDGTAFTTLKVKERTYTNIASYTASGSFVVPADTYVIRGYAFGAGADGATDRGGAGGGCAYGDIAVTPGETVTVTIASNIAKVITSATDRLTANPAVTTTGGTASKHASVTNGGAYAGGDSAAASNGGGSASGSPLGVGGNSVGQVGGAAWGGFAGGGGGGAGVGEAGTNPNGGGSLRTPANLFTDPLLAPLTGAGGIGFSSSYGGVAGGPGAGGGGGGGSTFGGGGGVGGGGGAGYWGGGSVFGGGGGRGSSNTGGAGGLGGGGGGTGSPAGTGGAACVLIYY